MGKFEKLFGEFFGLAESEVHDDIKYQEIESWDSINHLNFVTILEENYKIEFDMDEIIDMSSVKKIKEIIKKHNVDP